jgi:hypothetical protein
LRRSKLPKTLLAPKSLKYELACLRGPVNLTRIRDILLKMSRLSEGEPGMSELKVLVGNVDGLKELLRIAWKDLANPLLTAFERREARNQIAQYSVDLRRHLQLIQAERTHSRKDSSAEDKGRDLGAPKLRLLSGGS